MGSQRVSTRSLHFSPRRLTGVVRLARTKAVGGSITGRMFRGIFSRSVSPRHCIRRRNLGDSGSRSTLHTAVRRVIGSGPRSIRSCRGKGRGTVKFLIKRAVGTARNGTGPKVMGGVLGRLLWVLGGGRGAKRGLSLRTRCHVVVLPSLATTTVLCMGGRFVQ